MKINFDDLFSRSMPQTTIGPTFSYEKQKNIKKDESINKEKQLSGKTKLSISRNVEFGNESRHENSHDIL